jgi:Mrp family chromosome partitioning ATPase
LQLGPRGTERRIFAVTSPAAGTGKTSLTLAMGVSFAATNAKTLIIDCDMVGGGLTLRVDAIIRRKIGQILLRAGLVNQQQLDAAMKIAQNSQRKIGEVLVDLKVVSTDDLQRALTAQLDMPVGMLDALAGEDLENCIAETGIDNLSILPLGAASGTDVSKLSPTSIRVILEKAKQRFDTILIDTGPVPGSLEASVVAAAADAVVMVVSRGEQRPMAERSIQHLREIGAVLAGMVFNRAEGRDVEISTTTNRLSSIERSGFRSVSSPNQAEATGKFGPVARAVTSRAVGTKNEPKS